MSSIAGSRVATTSIQLITPFLFPTDHRSPGGAIPPSLSCAGLIASNVRPLVCRQTKIRQPDWFGVRAPTAINIAARVICLTAAWRTQSQMTSQHRPVLLVFAMTQSMRDATISSVVIAVVDQLCKVDQTLPAIPMSRLRTAQASRCLRNSRRLFGQIRYGSRRCKWESQTDFSCWARDLTPSFIRVR